MYSFDVHILRIKITKQPATTNIKVEESFQLLKPFTHSSTLLSQMLNSGTIINVPLHKPYSTPAITT